MTLQTELDGARKRHEDNLKAIEEKHRERVANAQANHERSELAFNTTRVQVGQRDPTYARWYFYWPFLLALASLEVPVNQLAFQLYFGEGSLLSTVITFGIGVVLVYFAHMIGVTLRRFRHNSESTGGSAASMAWLLLLLLLSIIISYSLAILRQGYLEFQSTPEPSLVEMINQGRQLEAAATIIGKSFLKFALAIDGWIFFFINIAILTVGVLASFWSHDPHPSYAKQHQAMKKDWAELQRRTLDRGRDIGAEEAGYAAKQDQIRRKYESKA